MSTKYWTEAIRIIVENGKIMEATKRELYQRWLNEGWDRMMPFEEYVYHLKNAGVEVKEENNGSLER